MPDAGQAAQAPPAPAPPPPPRTVPAPPAEPEPSTEPTEPEPTIELELPAEPEVPPEPEAAPEPQLEPLSVGPDGTVTVDELLRYVVRNKASDLHIIANAPPTVRFSGIIHALGYRPMEPRECQELATALMTEKERNELEEIGEVDFAFSLAGVGRFRVNVHSQRGTIGIAARRILPGAPDFDELGMPPGVKLLAGHHRGLVLVTGPTSSGKTTTCGAILKYINHSRRCHIVTIEDPIEILHEHGLAVVTQREIGQDTKDFRVALRAAMRQDPDVIFVGEIRDTETVQAALQAAETGHFVLATLHTTDAVETINRIIDFFPPHQQKQVRITLAGSLAGVVTQRLLPKVGGGRAAAVEVMIMNGRIRDRILEPQKMHEIHDVIADSGFHGMQTFDQAMVNLYREGSVTLENAKDAASNPHDFQLALQKAGLLVT